MRYPKKFKCILVIILIVIGFSQAQVTISGILLDSDNVPVAGANIYLEGTVLGTASNADGIFTLRRVPAGSYNLVVSFIGFEQHIIPLEIQDTDIDLKKITLKSLPLQSQPIVSTASRHKQNFQDVPVSIANVDAIQIAERNASTIADAIKYTSGVNLTGDQVNIRGSSGYSRL